MSRSYAAGGPDKAFWKTLPRPEWIVVLNGPKLRWGPLATGTAQRPTDSRGQVASSFFFVEVALLKGARRPHFAGLPQAGAGSAKNS